MSDEMVQEKTETPAETVPQNGSSEDHVSGAVEGAAPVSSPAPVTTDSPASSTEGTLASPAAAPDADADAFDQAMQALDMNSQYDKSLNQLQQDTVIFGTVMRVDREGVLVDVGAKSEGIIRLNELSRDANANLNPESIVQVGERIRVYVLEPENQDGIPVLSKKRADFEQAWEKVQQSKESNETIFAMVSDRVKGGLVVDLGIRGFVPASHVGSGSLKNNLDKYIGQSIPLKVIEVDKERRKVVLSNKLAVAEERDVKSQETKASLTPNQVRRGTVRRLTNYGAFIDLGGIDGLLHISEMSWTRINDPKEVLREGQELDVLILKMDLENNRVSLGLRQILPDPWTEIASRYKEGDVITGTVTRLVPFGVFVQVEGGIEGIIPNIELSRTRPKGSAGVNQGEEVTVKVIAMKADERKMTLSLRALQPPEERDMAPPREGAPREGREPREGGREGAPREGREPREGGREGREPREGGREGAPREGREPREGGREAPPRQTDREPAPREGSGREPKRGRTGEREEREDYVRYAPAREEPRFNQLGEAFAAARRNERNRRDRRPNPEEEEGGDFDLEEDLDLEPTEETDAEAEA